MRDALGVSNHRQYAAVDHKVRRVWVILDPYFS